ncbi:ribbon-helix-helix domain [Sulfolobales Beppu filamentous virus 2]|uniref:Ribbon-helix-helix domain n=1 Tax=Sulfolobales Beppu filamentous virus 2 TaxID=2493123 RepID=A0A3Q8Q976_9VIRU|nr:ribbon-helix-helix domain [Sulfolobales Beppu filamentous virus 2]AZI75803.1 ribbon-helix-helix domain [Sulfolobales Beppu filamentous virus 2]
MADYVYITSIKLFVSDYEYIKNHGQVQQTVRNFIEECIEMGFDKTYPLEERLHTISIKLTKQQEKMLKDYVKKYNGNISQFIRNCVHYNIKKIREREKLGIARVEKIPFL